MSEETLKRIEVKVTTNAPDFFVKFEDEKLAFNEDNIATFERPIGWDCTFYYELINPELGQHFIMDMTGRSKPVEVHVETDSKSVFGFAGYVIE